MLTRDFCTRLRSVFAARQVPKLILRWTTPILMIVLVLSACNPAAGNLGRGEMGAQPGAAPPAPPPGPPPDAHGPSQAGYPPRPRYAPGELVDYVAQPGDTLVILAQRFNTSVAEILKANSFIPASASTMPPGMPMKIPVYYLPLWGSPYQILPDSLFANGPAQVDFDTTAFVNGHPGWLKNYTTYVADANRSGANIVDYVAYYYSVSPRLLLALLEYRSGALSQPEIPPGKEDYPLGYERWDRKGLFLQLTWATNTLSNGFFNYRLGRLQEIQHKDGRIARIDPWQNALTASLQHFFNLMDDGETYDRDISPQGLAQTYRDLFGDPWANPQPYMPGSLEQPAFQLPFEPGDIWALTGGPHAAWGTGEPRAALDFAPPSKMAGCVSSDVWATAVADGVVVRSETGQVILDLDGDGDERTGWDVFYLHVATNGRVPMGARLKQGERIGHPSCEGGEATGTHIHIARKYNGEWVPAGGIDGKVLAFNFEGWIAREGSADYQGTLARNALLVIACTCSNAKSFIQSDRQLPPGAPAAAPTSAPP
jgi:LasA protease